MQNQAMRRKLQKNEAVDVSKCERTITGDYILPTFQSDKDYCNAETEQWIWSVGCLTVDLPSVMFNGERRTLSKGTYLAAESAKWYQNSVCECVWLR